ncbi:Mannosyl-oligosaccharide 1,2-alpha-mannosidase IB [Chytridiales sp. JEL 0842]|nr:Mannosyl-oligosaccharide 1,2-alpha-mannosidase IB [Chytridiales sp. JEL 0842]
MFARVNWRSKQIAIVLLIVFAILFFSSTSSKVKDRAKDFVSHLPSKQKSPPSSSSSSSGPDRGGSLSPSSAPAQVKAESDASSDAGPKLQPAPVTTKKDTEKLSTDRDSGYIRTPWDEQDPEIGEAKGGLNLGYFISTGRKNGDKQKMDFVRKMMQHAWKGYKDHAWGYDELRPNSQTGFNWYGTESMLSTPVDALDTLYIMNLHTEYEEAKKIVLEDLQFKGRKRRINVFETIIRVVGGLLSAYELDGDPKLLTKCVELADLMLPAFDTENGMPLNNLNLSSGIAIDSYSFTSAGLAEVGTLQLEFQYLTDVTGKKVYAEKALRIFDLLNKSKAPQPGLYKDQLSVTDGPDTLLSSGGHYSIGGMSDSFYEYLLKLWLSTGDEKYWDMYYRSAKAMGDWMYAKDKGHIYLSEKSGYNMDFNNGQFTHLACFAGGMLAMGALASRKNNWTFHLDIAQQVTLTCFQSYNSTATKLGPESFHVGELRPSDARYLLRPEVIESIFYMWRFTHDPMYREWGWQIAQALEKHCRNEAGGYHGLLNVAYAGGNTIDDLQQSFFLAETLKYLYLIFAPDDVIPLEKYVFNTEAHPISVRGHGRRSDPKGWVDVDATWKELKPISDDLKERRRKERDN